MPGYFFSNAAFSGRIAWLTISVVYQTTLPSFFAASISAASAPATSWLGVSKASASRPTNAERIENPLPTMCGRGHRVVSEGRVPAAPSMAGARGNFFHLSQRREIVAEPAPQQIPDADIALAEHEMVGIADEVQLGRLAGALEQLDRLFGGRD